MRVCVGYMGCGVMGQNTDAPTDMHTAYVSTHSKTYTHITQTRRRNLRKIEKALVRALQAASPLAS